MKTVYFVRHGESEGNAGPIFQGMDSPLTDEGKQQALDIAERCSKLPVELLISSPAKRTAETAQAISERSHIPIEWSPLFLERQRPLEVVGNRKDDPVMKAIEDQWFKSPDAREYRSKGEGFVAINERAGKALALLGKKTEQHILVVTHGFFLRAMMAKMLFGDALTLADLERVMAGFRTENTGITVITDDSWLPHMKWRIRVFNDHAHLG
ncbi:MAG: histidine phosphatase family protein [Candidatus Paceibacterota bacterium]